MHAKTHNFLNNFYFSVKIYIEKNLKKINYETRINCFLLLFGQIEINTLL